MQASSLICTLFISLLIESDNLMIYPKVAGQYWNSVLNIYFCYALPSDAVLNLVLFNEDVH